MKILYHHRIASKDGQYVHIEDMIDAFKSLGHGVLVIGPSAIKQESFGGESRWIAKLKKILPKAIYEVLELMYCFKDYVALRRAIKRYQPDFIYERYNLYFVSGVFARRRYDLPLIVEVNAPIRNERSKYGGLALNRLARWSERITWLGADHVFTVTEILARQIVAESVPEVKISVTPNGVNERRFSNLLSREDAKSRFGLKDKVVLGFTGFVRPWHGLEQVIDYICERRDPRLHFMIVGDGPASEFLRAHAASKGVTAQVEFAGLVGRDDIPAYMAAFDIALQPEVVPYASPLKLFEYLAAGCAIVAPDRDNIREVLRHGVDGLLFEPGNPDSLARQIDRLVADPGLRATLGAAARQLISRRDFTWLHNAKVVTSVATSLMGGRERCCGTAVPSRSQRQGLPE